MTWTLFIITLTANGYSIQTVDTHASMAQCFAQREHIVRSLGKPIHNDYQAVCVSKKVTHEE